MAKATQLTKSKVSTGIRFQSRYYLRLHYKALYVTWVSRKAGSTRHKCQKPKASRTHLIPETSNILYKKNIS